MPTKIREEGLECVDMSTAEDLTVTDGARQYTVTWLGDRFEVARLLGLSVGRLCACYQANAFTGRRQRVNRRQMAIGKWRGERRPTVVCIGQTVDKHASTERVALNMKNI